MDMFAWSNSVGDVEMIYSSTGSRLDTQISHRTLKQFGKARPVTFGANEHAHIAVDAQRRVAFWTQGLKIYASAFHEESNHKANYKLIANLAASQAPSILSITNIEYEPKYSWLYILQVLLKNNLHK